MSLERIEYTDAAILNILEMLDADSELSRADRCNFAEFLAILDGIADGIHQEQVDALSELKNAVQNDSGEADSPETEIIASEVRRIDEVEGTSLYVVEAKGFTAYVAKVKNRLAVIMVHVSGIYSHEENERAKKNACVALKIVLVRALVE